MKIRQFELHGGTMIRASAVLVALLSFITTPSSAEDFELVINGVSTPIDIGVSKTITTPTGQSLNLLLKQNEFVRYKSEMFSFEHHSKLKPSKTTIGEGVDQTIIGTSTGSVIIIQQYSRLNPSALIDLMGQELTKQEIVYGFELSEVSVERKFGEFTLRGKKFSTFSQGQGWDREIVAFGEKDRGLLIVAMINRSRTQDDEDLIERFWKSLRLSR